MAVKRVGADDIKEFNELYYQLHSYAAVARKTGFSASTVSKYVDKNYHPVAEEDIKRFNRSMLPKFTGEAFRGIENYGDLCNMTSEEFEEIKELWKEMSI